MRNSFFSEDENRTIEAFLRDGYCVVPLAPIALAQGIRENLYRKGLELLDRMALRRPSDEKEFFDRLHELVPVEKLNELRLSLIAHLAQDSHLRSHIFQMGRQPLEWIVGNELAMQRTCNLSIQLPKDASSLLPVHSDVWSGNSPYEVVFWLPLVDVYRTKSMFILPRTESDLVYQNFKEYSKLSAEEFFHRIKPKLQWVDIPFGHALIFSHALPHGNRVNEEPETRWTINVRFKSLFSPYGTKELGESFLPITLRPATRLGHAYRAPEVAHGGA